MKLSLLAGALGLSLLSSAALAQDPVFASPAGGIASPVDRQFVGRASASNTFEIRSSQMALRKSRDPAVRDLARWMIDAHTTAEHKLREAASYQDYFGSADPVVNPRTEGMLADLSAVSGADFDRLYVTDQVAAHQLTAQQMSDYAVQGSYAPLLRYEAMTLPQVDDHLAHFADLQAHMARGSSDNM